MNQQTQRDPVKKLLQERVVLGLYPGTPLPVPPKEALEALLPLWEELREKERRRDQLILLGWFALAVLQSTACYSCTGGTQSPVQLVVLTTFCVALASPLPLVLLCRRRKALMSCCEIVRSVTDQAMERECVGPLLDLLGTHGLEGTHYRMEAALTRLLPRLTTDEVRALTEKQRTALRMAIIQRGVRNELVVAGLLVLGTAQDKAIEPLARKLFLYSKNEQVREAADEYFKALSKTSLLDDNVI